MKRLKRYLYGDKMSLNLKLEDEKVERMTRFPHLTLYVDHFEVAKNKLVRQWMANTDVIDILQRHQITTDFYGKYFGSKILSYAIGVIRGTNALGNCPVVGVMLIFFEKRQIELEEVFMICVNLKNTLIQFMLEEKILTYETLNEMACLIDHNFVGVIRDYIRLHYSNREEHPSCSINPKSGIAQNFYDIYQSNERGTVTSAMHYLQEVEIDLGLIDELDEIEKETLDAIDLSMRMDSEAYKDVIGLLNNYIKVINDLLEFQELVSSLKILVALLEMTPIEKISIDNSGVLSIYITAIINDLSMWRKSVFVDQSAEDIHYLDKTLLSSIAQLQITLSESDAENTEDIEFF